ncbi:outer membrane beta-barrel protein [Flavobacterium sp. 3-218]
MTKFLLTTLLFYCTFINAQISFEKGYIISNDGKRTECFIKNLDWKNNPTDFRYKIHITDNDSKTETIANVQEFGIDNNTAFKRAKVKMDRSSDNFETISQTGKPVWEENTLFLKILVQGEAKLYSFREDNLIRYFYETPKIPLEQLVHLKYIESKDGMSTGNLQENNYYKQQLNNNVRASNTSDRDIESLQYKKPQLVKYFIKYNNIDANTENNDELKTRNGKLHLKITPQVSLISMTMNDGDVPSKDVDLDNKTNFKIGAELEYVMPFNKNKWSLFINPAYQKYENNITYSRPGTFAGSPEKVRYVEIKYSSVQLPIGLRHYFFLNNNSKIFINAAYSLEINGKASISFDNNLEQESNTDSNFAFGVGYNFKDKFSIEIRANSKKELLSDYDSFSAKYGAIDFVFGYTFF